ncbi:hypothetical protein SLA2020_065500 [Shorea laevis]
MEYEVTMILYHFPNAQMVVENPYQNTKTLSHNAAKETLGLHNTDFWSMKLIAWNCCGAANQSFMRHFRDLKNTHSPVMMLILETKLAGDRARDSASNLYSSYHIVDAEGYAGGLWLLWDRNQISVEVVSTSNQAIHAIVKVRNHPTISNVDWFFSGIYGRPQFDIRSLLWQELTNLAEYVFGPWIISGDFNDVLLQTKKFGGLPVNQTRIQAYSSCMNACNMMDLGFVGGRFTWVNMQSDGQIIREHLDRFWGNPEWRTSFPEATVFHLPRVHSDHNPILLNLNPS